MIGYILLGIIFTAMILAIGVYPSISDCYRDDKKDNKLVFTFGLMGTGILFAFLAGTLVESVLIGLSAFIAGSFIAAVPMFPNFWLKQEAKHHVVAASGGILMAFVTLAAINWIVGVSGLVLFGIAALLMKLFKINNYTYWVEFAAFYIVYAELGIIMSI